VDTEIVRHLIDRHAIYAGASSVASYLPVRLPQIIRLAYFFHQLLG
jgi:hypothetical protein